MLYKIAYSYLSWQVDKRKAINMNENGGEILDACSIMEVCDTLQIPNVVEVREVCEVICDVNKLQDNSNSCEIIERPIITFFQKESKKEKTKLAQLNEAFKDFGVTFTVISKHQSVKWVIVFFALFGSFSSITLVPYHNVIKFPEYWYEPLVPGVFGLYPCIVPFYLIQCSTILEYPPLRSPKLMFSMFVTTATAVILTYILIYLVWSVYLGYNFPMPLFVYPMAYVSMCTLFTRIWHQFPTYLRKAPDFRKRLKAYYGYVLWVATFTIQFMVIQKICVYLERYPQIQWIIAIVLALSKKLNASMLNHLLCKAAGSKKSKAKGMAKLQVELAFSFTIVIIIGSKATELTTYSILGLNFLLNIILCINCIRLHRKVADANNGLIDVRNKTKSEMLTELVLNETVEFVVPMLFIITFSITFYGPNATIIGNVRNDYWQYQKVNDIKQYLTGAFKMTLIDALSGVISMILLRIFCNVNGFNLYIKVFRKYGLLLAINSVLAMNQVRI